MRFKALLAAATLVFATQVSATPAMSVVTVHTPDPMGYMDWARTSGPAIAKAIDAALGGVCLSTAGFSSAGELYYWHWFSDHGTAMNASIYNEDVAREVSKLETPRQISESNLFAVRMMAGGDDTPLKVGDTFANWNLMISTDEAGLYMQQLEAIVAAAKENGYGDISVNAYATLTGEMAGTVLVAISADTATRLGEFVEQLTSPWMAPIMSNLAGIRSYEGGITMHCTTTYVSD